MSFSALVKQEIVQKIMKKQTKFQNIANKHCQDGLFSDIIYTYEDSYYSDSCANLIAQLFLDKGSIANPQKAYYLQFAIKGKEELKGLIDALGHFDLQPKVMAKGRVSMVYFKDGSQIATLLNIMKAHVSLMDFENMRIEKDVRGSINRLVNSQTANDFKTIEASAKHIKDINAIDKAIGLAALDKPLEDIARLRRENPLLSLSEIAKLLSPPISKSGANHRLKKIAEIAKGINSDV